MEENTSKYLILIANSIALLLLWMIVNVFFGIYVGYAFFDSAPAWYNILYYVAALTTFLLMARFILRKWNRFVRE